MSLPLENRQFFHTSAELQEFLLTQPPGVLVIVPQMRLAHQVWRRQRLAAMAAGQAAWEPVAMTTLSGWFQQLWHQLWLPVRPATVWQRLVLWLQAMAAIPPEEGVAADLSWAALLDEAFDLCQRYRLPPPTGLEAESPLIIWRQAVSQKFAAILDERGLITSAAMPDFLLEALRQGNLALPDQIVLVGLETPAPAGAAVAEGGGPATTGSTGSSGGPPGTGRQPEGICLPRPAPGNGVGGGPGFGTGSKPGRAVASAGYNRPKFGNLPARPATDLAGIAGPGGHRNRRLL